MDRVALSKRLKGLSAVFASGHPIQRDLSAMAHVLADVDDEKFASMLNSEYNADTEAGQEAEAGGSAYPVAPPAQGGRPGIPNTPSSQANRNLPGKAKPLASIDKDIAEAIARMADPKQKQTAEKAFKELQTALQSAMAVPKGQPVLADDSQEEVKGTYWNREASEAVINNLVRDVTGSDKSICCDTKQKLTPDQRPEGQHNGEKASTLKPDQTPDQKDVLKSGIVEKSKGAVKKEATKEVESGSKKGPGIPDGTGPRKDSPACPKKDDAEEIEVVEEVEATEEPKVEEKEEAKEEEKEASSIVAEGIELVAAMEDVTLSDSEAKKLNQLFQ